MVVGATPLGRRIRLEKVWFEIIIVTWRSRTRVWMFWVSGSEKADAPRYVGSRTPASTSPAAGTGPAAPGPPQKPP